jgi:hypothetical protein
MAAPLLSGLSPEDAASPSIGITKMDLSQDTETDPKAPRRRIPVGALLFGVFLALAMGAYAWSILDAARRTTDWLLILPVAGIGIFAIAFAIIDDVQQGRQGRQHKVGEGDARIGAALVVLVLGFAGASPWLGFDIATGLFIALALILQGERRPHVVVPVALLTAGALVYLFKHVMGVPIPSSLI